MNLTQTEIEKIKELNAKGLNKKYIAAQLNKTVKEISRAYAVLKLRCVLPSSFWTQDKVDKIREMVDEKYTKKEIAAFFGFESERKVDSVIRSRGIRSRTSNKWTDKNIEDVKGMLQNGMQIKEIAKLTNRTEVSIVWLINERLKLRKEYPHVNKAINEYRNSKMTAEQYIKIKYQCAKRSARESNMEFDLTADYLISLYYKQNKKCFYSLIDMEHKYHSPFSISIDRIDSDGGYTKENIVLCCWNINMMKRDNKKDVFIDLCTKIADNFKNQSKDSSSPPPSLTS